MMEYVQFFLQHWILSALFLAVLAVLLWLELRGKANGVARLTAAEAINLINKENAKVIDVREKGAFNNGHIVHAMHATTEEIQEGAKKLQTFKQQPVILVCAMGPHSSQMGAKLKKQGFDKVYFLQGGINGWKADNLPLVKD